MLKKIIYGTDIAFRKVQSLFMNEDSDIICSDESDAVMVSVEIALGLNLNDSVEKI